MTLFNSFPGLKLKAEVVYLESTTSEIDFENGKIIGTALVAQVQSVQALKYIYIYIYWFEQPPNETTRNRLKGRESSIFVG